MLPKILWTVLLLAIAGTAMWSTGVFDPASDADASTEIEAGAVLAAQKKKSDAKDGGGELAVSDDAAKRKKAQDVVKKARVGIGNTGKPPHGAAVFPDGTWLPPLNGVKVAPEFPGFAPGYPYSPVVRIEKGDKGISWYIHADGSHSSTQLVETTQAGRKFTQAGWAVGNPTKTLPVEVPGGDAKGGADGNGFGPRAKATGNAIKPKSR